MSDAAFYFAILIIAFVMLILILTGIRDIIKEFKSFCLPGVVTGQDFESKHPASLTACRVFDRSVSENNLLLKRASLGVHAAPTIENNLKIKRKTL